MELTNHISLENSVLWSLLDTVQLGLVIWKLENENDLASFRLKYCNDAAVQAAGIELKNYIGCQITEVFPAVLKTSIPEIYRNCLKTGETALLNDVAYSDENIPHAIFYIHVIPIDTTHIALEFRNISDEKAEYVKKLKESELRFRQVTENIAEVFWVSNADLTEILYISPAYEKIWERSCEDLYADAREWFDAIHPDDKQRVAAAVDLCVSTGHMSVEYRVLTPNRATRWIWDRGFPVRDTMGNIYRLTGISEDITTRKQAEFENARFSAILEATPDLVGIASLEHVIYLNPAGRKLLGLAPDYSMDEDELFHYHPQHTHPKIRDEIIPYTEQYGSWSGELPFLDIHNKEINTWSVMIAHKNNQNITEYYSVVSRVLDDNILMDDSRTENKMRNHIALIHANQLLEAEINKRREVEKALLHQRESLEESIHQRSKSLIDSNRKIHEQQQLISHLNRVQSLGEMAATLAHELNQPLTSILTYIHVCKLRKKNNNLEMDDFFEIHEKIDQQANRASDVIKSLRSFTKNTVPVFNAISINGILRESCNILLPELQDKNIVVEYDLQPDIAMILGDKTQLQQVFVNLLKNAIDAHEIKQTDKRIKLATSEKKQIVYVDIMDWGRGLPEHAESEDLFNKFYTTKDNGLGMGLAICRSIIEAHNGQIKIHPAQQKPTQIVVELPMEENYP